jgi:hypothetical protein
MKLVAVYRERFYQWPYSRLLADVQGRLKALRHICSQTESSADYYLQFRLSTATISSGKAAGFKIGVFLQIRPTRIGTAPSSTNLPLLPAQFATLEIEQLPARGQETKKPPLRWLFVFPQTASEPSDFLSNRFSAAR